jgi:hypothetical protein
VAESFFSTLEFEGPATATWRGVADATPELFTLIESYYNQIRLHSHNGYRTPNEIESDLRNGEALAAQSRRPRIRASSGRQRQERLLTNFPM